MVTFWQGDAYQDEAKVIENTFRRNNEIDEICCLLHSYNKNERNSGGQSNEPVKSISLRCIKKAFSGKGYSNQILGRSSQMF